MSWPGYFPRLRRTDDTLGFGKHVEKQAARYLERRGLILIMRNYRCRRGEIDLVMRDKDNCLVFVEVRYRETTTFGSPFDSITPAKQARLRKAAASFLLRHKQYRGWRCRFDVVGVTRDKQNRALAMQWISNAFM